MLNFACWNINGFALEKIKDECFYEKFYFFCITETWTSKESNIILPGYKAVTVHGTKRNCRKGRKSGGIIVYIKENFARSA